MLTLDKLKRCPKCGSADLTFPWQRGTLPDCWHCYSCLENFDTPVTLESPATPTNPESAATQPLREPDSELLAAFEAGRKEHFVKQFLLHGFMCNCGIVYNGDAVSHQIEMGVRAATDSLIETAIERCEQEAQEVARAFKRYSDDPKLWAHGDADRATGASKAASVIHALTPASIREEHARRKGGRE